LYLSGYPADVTGDGRYNSLDSLRIQRYLVNLDRWFPQYPLTDPVLVGDVNVDGRVNSLDLLYIQRYLVNISVPFLAPPNVTSVNLGTGLDPIIRIGSVIRSDKSGMIQVPIEIVNSDQFDISLNSVEFALDLDPAVFRLLSIKPSENTMLRMMKERGRVGIYGTLPNLRLKPGDTIRLAIMNLRILPDVKVQEASINLLDESTIRKQRFVTSLNSGDLVLHPRPTPNHDDTVDGLVQISHHRRIRSGMVRTLRPSQRIIR
jgi:hypothetical protein